MNVPLSGPDGCSEGIITRIGRDAFVNALTKKSAKLANDLENERELRKRQLADSHRTISHLEQQILDMETWIVAEVGNLEQQIADKSGENDRLSNELQATDIKLAHFQNKLANSVDLNEHTRRVAHQKDKAECLEQTITELKIKNTEIEQTLQSLKRTTAHQQEIAREQAVAHAQQAATDRRRLLERMQQLEQALEVKHGSSASGAFFFLS
jgi:hypothetical protein